MLPFKSARTVTLFWLLFYMSPMNTNPYYGSLKSFIVIFELIIFPVFVRNGISL